MELLEFLTSTSVAAGITEAAMYILGALGVAVLLVYALIVALLVIGARR